MNKTPLELLEHELIYNIMTNEQDLLKLKKDARRYC